MSGNSVQLWDGRVLAELLQLDHIGKSRFRNRISEANAHGRCYGGQLLAQALAAAAATVPPGRDPTAMQFLFLQGARPEEAIDLDVTPLQDGKRFASRHVRGTQFGERVVFDAHCSFAPPMAGPAHGVAWHPKITDPLSLPTASELEAGWSAALKSVLGYDLARHPLIDVRFDRLPPGMKLSREAPALGFWIRIRQRLADDARLHAIAFAYLSDWWINFPSMGGHIGELEARGERLYVTSLNHAIWIHRPLRADDWLHFDVHSPAAHGGRGLSVARIHDIEGQLVASAMQENLMTIAGPGADASTS